MRIVADTNIVVSALLWRGNPRRLLDAARDGIIELFTSAVLLEELEEVLSRDFSPPTAILNFHVLSVGTGRNLTAK